MSDLTLIWTTLDRAGYAPGVASTTDATARQVRDRTDVSFTMTCAQVGANGGWIALRNLLTRAIDNPHGHVVDIHEVLPVTRDTGPSEAIIVWALPDPRRTLGAYLDQYEVDIGHLSAILVGVARGLVHMHSLGLGLGARWNVTDTIISAHGSVQILPDLIPASAGCRAQDLRTLAQAGQSLLSRIGGGTLVADLAHLLTATAFADDSAGGISPGTFAALCHELAEPCAPTAWKPFAFAQSPDVSKDGAEHPLGSYAAPSAARPVAPFRGFAPVIGGSPRGDISSCVMPVGTDVGEIGSNSFAALRSTRPGLAGCDASAGAQTCVEDSKVNPDTPAPHEGASYAQTARSWREHLQAHDLLERPGSARWRGSSVGRTSGQDGEGGYSERRAGTTSGSPRGRMIDGLRSSSARGARTPATRPRGWKRAQVLPSPAGSVSLETLRSLSFDLDPRRRRWFVLTGAVGIAVTVALIGWATAGFGTWSPAEPGASRAPGAVAGPAHAGPSSPVAPNLAGEQRDGGGGDRGRASSRPPAPAAAARELTIARVKILSGVLAHYASGRAQEPAEELAAVLKPGSIAMSHDLDLLADLTRRGLAAPSDFALGKAQSAIVHGTRTLTQSARAATVEVRYSLRGQSTAAVANSAGVPRSDIRTARLVLEMTAAGWRVCEVSGASPSAPPR